MPSATDFFSLLHPDKLTGALILFGITIIVALFLSRLFKSAITRTVRRQQGTRDVTGLTFFKHLGGMMIWLIALTVYAHFIPALDKLGTALLAGVSIASVVIGLAAQSTIGNLFAGFSLVLYRPFRVGDRIQLNTPNGVETGTVEAISLGYTTLVTFDNRRIVLSNSAIMNQVMVNLTSVEPRIMAVMPISIGYGSDIDKAREIILDLAVKHALVTNIDGCPLVALGTSSVDFSLRVWCKDSGDAWRVKNDLFEAIKKRFDAEGIEIPFAYQNVILKAPEKDESSAVS